MMRMRSNWIYLLLKLGFVFWISVPSKGVELLRSGDE